MAKRNNHKQVDRVIDYKTVFSSEAGKEVLYDLMKVGGMLHSSFDPKQSSLEMAFNEGQRNMVLRILTTLNMDPKKLRDFINEREEE